MPLITYIDKTFHRSSYELITIINEIEADYAKQGYNLTLRQLYYQLVARGYIENSEKSYKKIGNLVNDARLAGLVDWNSITDRTRQLRSNTHWSHPQEIIDSAIYSYAIDKRSDQPYNIEIWVEKEALADIVAKVAVQVDLPYFACRGYVSQSEMWAAAQRFIDDGRYGIIIHLGDHDPSGIDMTRDIRDRMEVFGAYHVEVKRIALNYDQIEEYTPPPNPAKFTDSRINSYLSLYGSSSWELDALEPAVITNLIKSTVDTYTDFSLLVEKQKKESKDIARLNEYRNKL